MNKMNLPRQKWANCPSPHNLLHSGGIAMSASNRRVQLTKKLLKEAFLALIAAAPYHKLTVSALCRKADVQRSTFYLHYNQVGDILNNLVDEALQEAAQDERTLRKDFQALADLIHQEAPLEILLKKDCLLPICQRLAFKPEWKPLFQDETIAGLIMRRIYDKERPIMVPFLKAQGKMTEKEADELFTFLLYGSFYVDKMMGFTKDQDWYRLQGRIMTFILKGLSS